MKQKVFQVKAWIGVCDGEISWMTDATGRHRRALADLFRTRKAGLEIYDDVRRITITIHRGLEGPSRD